MIKIDREKCVKDGVCALACPMGLIQPKGEGGFPAEVPGAERVCLACGHCVSVCPRGALDHSAVPLKECPPVDKGLSVGAESAAQFLRSRRSVRLYQDKPVEREKIESLIKLASHAPTASNRQEVRWLVLTDKEKVRELARMTIDWMRDSIKGAPPAEVPAYLPRIVASWDAGRDGVLRGAPALVTAWAPKEIANGLVDLSIALSYLELAAPTLSLGTCWAGMLQRALKAHPPIARALGLPEGDPHCYPMMLGYPRLKHLRLPARRAAEIVWS